ncbi:MAG: hypothetical protein ABI047_12280, partial [Jatrophihabitantaceae bacterium]
MLIALAGGRGRVLLAAVGAVGGLLATVEALAGVECDTDGLAGAVVSACELSCRCAEPVFELPPQPA